MVLTQNPEELFFRKFSEVPEKDHKYAFNHEEKLLIKLLVWPENAEELFRKSLKVTGNPWIQGFPKLIWPVFGVFW